MADDAPPPGSLSATASHAPVVRTRGLPWASNAGWACAAAGLALAAYAQRHEADHRSSFTIGPVDVFLLGLFLGAAGVAVAVAFLATRRAVGPAPDAATWHGREEEARARLGSLRVFAFVGIGLLLVGLLFVALVYRADARADPPTSDLALGPLVQSFDRWAVMGVAVALVGSLLWLVLGIVEAVLRRYADACSAAASTTAGPGMNALAAASGVTDADVLALLQRLDGLLEQLPDGVVAGFAKTPEAGTYLKVLGKKAKGR